MTKLKDRTKRTESSPFPLEDFFLGKQFEINQRKFIRFLLGLSKHSCNLALYCESGALPLYFDILRNCLNFWLHILDSPDYSLLKIAYKVNKDLSTKNENIFNWCSQFSSILKYFGFEHLWINQGTFSSRKTISAFMESVKKDFFTMVRKYFVSQSVANGVFSSYIKINPKLEPPKFLLNFGTFFIRKFIFKLRSCDLAIETQNGRFRDKSLDKEERFCLSCDKRKCGDEYHFIFECSRLSTLRSIHLKEVTNKSLYEICNNESHSFNKSLSRFIKLAIREKWSKNQKS